MSLKVYTGFKLKNVKTLDDVMPFVHKIKPELNKLAYNNWTHFLMSQATLRFDESRYNNTPLKKDESPVTASQMLLMDILRNDLEKNLNCVFDYSLSLSFINTASGIVGIYFTANNLISNHFIKLEDVEDFSYSSITDDEYSDNRGEVWTEMFKKYNTPAEVMFTVDVIPVGPIFPNTDDFKKYIPNKQERVASLAERIAIMKFKEKHETSNLDFLKTNEYHDFLNSTKKSLNEVLPENVSANDLLETS